MPRDLKGRAIPERYLAGLSPTLRKRRIAELTESRDAYRRGDYSELPTDKAARRAGLVKQSAYTTVAKRRGIEWRGSPEDMAERVLAYYSGSRRNAEDFSEALDGVFDKGLAAWKSGGHRPGATAQQWAVARVNSLVVGGKTSWSADRKEFGLLSSTVRRQIVAELPEVYDALAEQGRTADVEYIFGAAKTRSNPNKRNPRRSAAYNEIAAMLRDMPSAWRAQYDAGRAALSRLASITLPKTPTPEQAAELMRLAAEAKRLDRGGDQPTGPIKVPVGVQREALDGLRMSHAMNYGADHFIGVARAIQLATSEGIPSRTQERMKAYFTRHAVDKRGSRFFDDERPSNGRMAWLNWGGDAGARWVGAPTEPKATGIGVRGLRILR